MGEPVGGALGRDPGHDENDSLPGQDFGANLYPDEHSPSRHLLEFTFGDVLPYP